MQPWSVQSTTWAKLAPHPDWSMGMPLLLHKREAAVEQVLVQQNERATARRCLAKPPNDAGGIAVRTTWSWAGPVRLLVPACLWYCVAARTGGEQLLPSVASAAETSSTPRATRAGAAQKAAIRFMALRLDGSSGCVRSMSTSAASLMICATGSASGQLLW